jgi:outer membrane protein OmpA-like peptidoglycan-associated protein
MDVKLAFFKRPLQISRAPDCARGTPQGIVFILIGFLSFLLFGCASSTVTRSAADQVDSAYQASNDKLTHAGDDDPAEVFQNSPQTTKGALLGASAGAVTGVVFGGTAGLLPGAAGGAAIGGVIGAYVDTRTTLRDQLENRGVKVMVLGDQVRIIMPADQVFFGMSKNMIYSSRSTFDAIAKYINLYHTQLVSIDTYTNDTGDKQVNCIISQQQASTIQRYLWPLVNTRVLVAKGHGGSDLLTANNKNWVEGINYRVEITFEKLPV